LAHYFLDTSALGKYYHPELGSDRVMEIVDRPSGRILISKLAFVEIQSVFAIKFEAVKSPARRLACKERN
jgi:hypothetical protein